MDIAKIPAPCFILDELKFINNIEVIRDARDRAGVRIIPALKGFAGWRAFHHLSAFTDTASASSPWEARLIAEKLGGKACTYSPAYTPESLAQLLPLSSHIIFNSLSQWEALGDQALRANVPCGLRINPGYSPVQTELYNPCSPGSRLGVPLNQLSGELPKGITGLHLHNLCESGAEALAKTLEVLEGSVSHLLEKISWLNLGGGHLITADHYKRELLVSALRDFQKKFPLEIWLEPGAAFVWQAGVLVATVLDIVPTDPVPTAMLDISFTAHLPDCLEMPYLPDIRGAKKVTANHSVLASDAPTEQPKTGSAKSENLPDGSREYVYQLGGLTCLAGDQLGNYSFDKVLTPGERLVFEDMMHYTTVKTHYFNGVAHPALGMWTRDNTFELWREFRYADYRDRLG